MNTAPQFPLQSSPAGQLLRSAMPEGLACLQGIDGTLVVRDGEQPEIVFKPNLQQAISIFSGIWGDITAVLEPEDDEAVPFDSTCFEFTVLPSGEWSAQPRLSYVDGLSLVTSPINQECLARVITALMRGYMARFGVRGALAATIGEAVAFVMTGVRAGAFSDFECALADALVNQEGHPVDHAGMVGIRDWEAVGPGIRRLLEMAIDWQGHPETYKSARAAWFRGAAWDVISKNTMPPYSVAAAQS